MNKTIYVRDEDVAIWDRAKELAGDKLAPVIMQGLRVFVAQKEAEQRGFERIEVQFRDARSNELPVAKAFIGRWMFPRDKPFVVPDQDGSGIVESGTCHAIAQTAKSRFAVLSWREDMGQPHHFLFNVYEDIDHMLRLGVHTDVTAAIAEQLGVQVEELDI